MPCRCTFRTCNCNGCKAKQDLPRRLGLDISYNDFRAGPHYYKFLENPTIPQEIYNEILCAGWFTD